MTLFDRRPAAALGGARLAAVALLIGAGLRSSPRSRRPPAARCRRARAAQLLVDVQHARLDGLSGTVVETTDLGLPALPGRRRAAAAAELLLAGVRLPHDAGLVRRTRPGSGWPCSASSASPTWSATAPTCGPGPARTTPPPTRTVPAGRHGTRAGSPDAGVAAVTPQQAADAALKAIDPTTAVSTDRHRLVAGRPAYQLVLAAADPRSLVGSVRIAIDGATHMPTRVQVFAQGRRRPRRSRWASPRSTRARRRRRCSAFNPPPGATVTEQRARPDRATSAGARHRRGAHAASAQAERRRHGLDHRAGRHLPGEPPAVRLLGSGGSLGTLARR